MITAPPGKRWLTNRELFLLRAKLLVHALPTLVLTVGIAILIVSVGGAVIGFAAGLGQTMAIGLVASCAQFVR